MLKMDFFYSEPIDFEMKNYLLMDYLSEIDKSYSLHKLSPYLLHTEKLILELDLFTTNRKLFEHNARKNIIKITETGIVYSEIDKPPKIKEIIEIVEWSKPLLDHKLKLGYKLYEKYPQLLY